MTSLSGHSGGTTSTITNIVRRKSNPRQPRTSAQSAARGTLGYLSKLWGGLTSAQQDAWIAAAPNHIKVKNGVAVPLKGITYFIEVNTNIITAYGDVILLPVAPVALPIQPILPYQTTSIQTVGDVVIYEYEYRTEYFDLPQGDWIPIDYWTKWKKPGVHSLGKASTIIPSQFQNTSIFTNGFFFETDVDGSPMPIGDAYKFKIRQVYINQKTGQVWELFTGTEIGGTGSNLFQPYIPGSVADGSVTTGTPPNLTVVATVNASLTSYDFSVWKPFFNQTQWGDSTVANGTGATNLIPDSAINFIDSTHLTITFGPNPGQALHPTAAGQIVRVVFGWENVITGEKEWESADQFTA